MLTEREVISTLDMLRSEHLDVRTVTLGLNLFDCASDNFDTFAYRVRSKINRHAKNLVAICNEVGDRYGIPVVNKRITVSPIGTVCAGYSRDQMVKVCKLLDDCATAPAWRCTFSSLSNTYNADNMRVTVRANLEIAGAA